MSGGDSEGNIIDLSNLVLACWYFRHSGERRNPETSILLDPVFRQGGGRDFHVSLNSTVLASEGEMHHYGLLHEGRAYGEPLSLS